MGSPYATFSPGKLDPVTAHEIEKDTSSQPGSSTCAYSDYLCDDFAEKGVGVIVEDPEEDTL